MEEIWWTSRMSRLGEGGVEMGPGQPQWGGFRILPVQAWRWRQGRGACECQTSPLPTCLLLPRAGGPRGSQYRADLTINLLVVCSWTMSRAPWAHLQLLPESWLMINRELTMRQALWGRGHPHSPTTPQNSKGLWEAEQGWAATKWTSESAQVSEVV